MEEKALSKPTMVSRLPKFGVRPQCGTSFQTNGSSQPAPCHEGKSAPPKRLQGMVRVPSFSLKWKKDSGGSSSLARPKEGAASKQPVQEDHGPALNRPVQEDHGPALNRPVQEDHGPALNRPVQEDHGPALKLSASREIKKPSTPVKVRRSALPAASASPKTTPAALRSGSQAAPKQTQPVQNLSSSRPNLNGLSGGVAAQSGTTGLLRPRANSSSARSGSRDSLKSLSLDNMVRSQSFTHFKQLPSPTSLPVTRSFSFNKAVELAKPLADTQLRTRTPLVKPALLLANGRPGGVSQLKKPSAPCYRLARPSLLQQPRLVLPGQEWVDPKAGEGNRDSVETPGGPEHSEAAVAPESQPEVSCLLPRQPESAARPPGEVLEDMSLSSASSLERNDTSEEYFDDFDNLGDGVDGLLMEAGGVGPGLSSLSAVDDNRQCINPSQTALHSILCHSMDWAGVNDDFGVSPGHGPLTLSPVRDIPHASSLELSPSNSSGGTYMWDEEGLEPLGPVTNTCGSYDSDVNSMDILNNIENLESCDLDDDDLMLDMDLLEDISFHSDTGGMSRFERSERGGRQGHWRRRQQRWIDPEHFHNDNRGVVLQQFDGYPGPGMGRIGHHSLKPGGRQDANVVALDETVLRNMAQDCSSVKTQLLKLKNLLQMEDGAHDVVSPADLSVEISEESSAALQVEELMREVQSLRQELKSKEKKIAQLSQQGASVPECPRPTHAQQFRCPGQGQCQHRGAVTRGERHAHHDKATQTPWRGHPPQILQSSNPCLSKHLIPERLARIAPTEDLSDPPSTLGDGGLHQGQAPSLRGTPAAPDADELSLLLTTRLKIDDAEAPAGAHGPIERAPPTRPPRLPDGQQRRSARSRTEGPPPNGCPRFLQSLRVHSKVTIPTMPPERAEFPAGAPDGRAGDRAIPRLGSPGGLSQLKQLPPPSRGLPCISSGAPARVLPRGRGELLPKPDLSPGPQKLKIHLLTKHSYPHSH